MQRKKSVLSVGAVWIVLAGLLLSCGIAAIPVAAMPLVQDQPPAQPARDGRRAQLVIPFEYQQPQVPAIVVRAKVNDSEPMRFIVDTGASYGLVLYPWAVLKLGLKATGEIGDVNDGEVKAKRLEGVRVAVQSRTPGAELRMRFTGTWEMRESPGETSLDPSPIAGIIGAPMVLTASSCIDFDTKTWTILSKGAAAPPSEGRKVWRVPMTKYSDEYEGLRVVSVAVADSTGKPQGEIKMMIDTGADTSVLPGKQAKLLNGFPRSREDRPLIGIGGAESVQDFLVPQLYIGDASAANANVAVSPSETDCLLGLDVLERFRLTFSPADDTLYLEERPGYTPRLPGETGLTLKERTSRDDSGYFFTSVKDAVVRGDGNGGSASLRVGDRLLSIDGKEVTTQLPLVVAHWLEFGEGIPAKLEVQTGNNPPRIVLVERRSRYTVTGKDAKK